jgi:hypothetical protein
MAAAPKKSYESRAEEEAAEYSSFVATSDIYHDGEVAYRPGHAVPVSNVERYKYHDQGLVKQLRGEEKAQAAAAVTDDVTPVQK